VLAAVGFAGWMWLRSSSRDVPTPIILISVDTLRADHLPVYGYTKVKTPAIDGLARDGIVFDRAYAHSPQTLPSHTAILTGQLPFETGIRDNVGFTLRADQPTLARFLHDGGFTTGGVASAFVLRKETGIARGFDFYDAELPPSGPDTPMGEVQRPGPESLAVATRWVGGLRSPRFFLFFHIYEPHTPYTPPARYSQYAPYDGEVAFSDEIVGRLLQFLKDKGLYDRALIVFLSDHGEGLGDHGEQEHGLFLYDETIRVPLVIKVPGSRGAGRRVDQPVQHLDLVPTILDLAGLRVPPDLRGRSLRPVLDRPDGQLPEPGFYSEAYYSRYHFGWSELVALTDARYRFIKAPRPELYDLVEDPHQHRNIVTERAPTAAAMRAGLAAMTKDAVTQAPQRVSREDLERLQALGYVGTAPADAAAPADSLPDPKDKAPILDEMRRAAILAASRRYDEAIPLLREVVSEDPGVKDAWLQLGVLLARAGRYEECLAAFKKLVELDPTDANSFVSVAGVLVTMNRLDEAQANAQMGLERAGTDSRARTSACEMLVNIALARNDDASARRYASIAQQADAQFPLLAFVEGRILHREKRFDEALARFEEAERQLKGRLFTIPELDYYIGDTLANLGRAGEAVAAFKRELAQSPGHLRTRASLAMLYRAAGDSTAAAHEIQQLLLAVPTREGYEMAAKTWSIIGEQAQADAVRAEAQRRFRAPSGK
jgi:arylsulfatase A-like enzyme/cytochrome c-type biogenesis protein CcmH/NrfG